MTDIKDIVQNVLETITYGEIMAYDMLVTQEIDLQAHPDNTEDRATNLRGMKQEITELYNWNRHPELYLVMSDIHLSHVGGYPVRDWRVNLFSCLLAGVGLDALIAPLKLTDEELLATAEIQANVERILDEVERLAEGCLQILSVYTQLGKDSPGPDTVLGYANSESALVQDIRNTLTERFLPYYVFSPTDVLLARVPGIDASGLGIMAGSLLHRFNETAVTGHRGTILVDVNNPHH